jgi:hypothetical protein
MSQNGIYLPEEVICWVSFVFPPRSSLALRPTVCLCSGASSFSSNVIMPPPGQTATHIVRFPFAFPCLYIAVEAFKLHQHLLISNFRSLLIQHKSPKG